MGKKNRLKRVSPEFDKYLRDVQKQIHEETGLIIPAEQITRHIMPYLPPKKTIIVVKKKSKKRGIIDILRPL